MYGEELDDNDDDDSSSGLNVMKPGVFVEVILFRNPLKSSF